MRGRKKKKGDRTETERRIAELAARIHPKRVLFLEHWLSEVATCKLRAPSRARALKKAGYYGGDMQLANLGRRIMNEPDCQEYISLRLRQHVNPDDILAMLTDQAMMDWSQFVSRNEEGKLEPNLEAIYKAGKMHLIQGVEYKKGRYVPQMISAQAALFKLADIWIAGSRRKGIDPQELLDRLPDVYMHEGHAFPLKEIFAAAVLASVEEEKALPATLPSTG